MQGEEEGPRVYFLEIIVPEKTSVVIREALGKPLEVWAGHIERLLQMVKFYSFESNYLH